MILIILSHSSLLYIEEDLLSEVGKGHKSEGDTEEHKSSAQVRLCPVYNLETNFLLQVAYRLNANGLIGNVGWFAGFMGCFKPMWMMMGKGKQQEIEKGNLDRYKRKIKLGTENNDLFHTFLIILPDDWEIPFEAIQDLQWLGSGAQGAVFMGKYNGEQVAVKKVKEEFETDIKHLRKLNHPNIVLFK